MTKTAKNYRHLLLVATLLIGAVCGLIIGFGLGAQLFYTDAPLFIISILGCVALAGMYFCVVRDMILEELEDIEVEDKS
jgi:ABC-type xylose transport system permease subunit